MDRRVSAERLLAEAERSSAGRGTGICQRAAARQQAWSNACDQVIAFTLVLLDPGGLIARALLDGSGLHQGKACREDSFPLIVLFPLPLWALLMVPWLGWTQHSPDIRPVKLSSRPHL